MEKQDAQILHDTIEADDARNALVLYPDLRDRLLGEILIRDSVHEQEVILPKLPSGVPEGDGSSFDGRGRTWQLRGLETLVYPYAERSVIALRTCIPQLQWICLELAMEFNITVLEGTRSMAKQAEVFESGASTVPPGKSKHNSMPSLAVDICPAAAPRLWAEGKDLPRAEYDKIAARAFELAKQIDFPLRWGGDWDGDGDTSDQKFNDLVHFERKT